MSDERPDTMTPLQEAATTLHEMYASLTEAGFTETQALALVAQVLARMTNTSDEQ